MKHKPIWFLSCLFVLGMASLVRADDPTSRFFPLSRLASSLPSSSTGNVVQFEVWDSATGGTMIFAEPHTVDTDGGSNITNDTGLTDLLLGRGTSGGLAPANFPAGSTRYLDVTQSGATVLTARVPLYASVFGISPPSDVPGNLTLADSSGTAGNILKGGVLFLHNFGFNNAFLGSNAGNLSMTGGNNTASGASALQNNTSGNYNTAIGTGALFSNTTAEANTATGYHALYSNCSVGCSGVQGASNTAIGASALAGNIGGFDNTAIGASALFGNGYGFSNTAIGVSAASNGGGFLNTAIGASALAGNINGDHNTAIGYGADVAVGNLSNATAIGANAMVNASNKVRIGNGAVTVIEGQVAYTFTSDKHQKENFQPLNAEDVLTKLAQLPVSTWNYIGHDPKQFRHYGPVAQDFFAAFGHDRLGTIGTDTTINSGDMEGILMIAVQALEKRTSELATLKAENADLKARLEKLERSIATVVVKTQ